MTITLLSLFTGYGGLDLGVADALHEPLDTIAVCDIEPGPSRILTHRYPHTPNLGDITQVDWTTLPHVDIICGGSPCQSMSVAGLRAGMHEGTRSGLWSYQMDAVHALHPSLMVWENVTGALSATASSDHDPTVYNQRARLLTRHGLCSCPTPTIQVDGFTPAAGEKTLPAAQQLLAWSHTHNTDPTTFTCTTCGRLIFETTADSRVFADTDRLNRQHTGPSIRALGRVLGDLANTGYDAVWHQVEAADTGAPHHRARIFLAAWPHDPQDRHPIPGLNNQPTRQPDGRPFAVWQPDEDVWVSGMGVDLFNEPDVYDGSWPASGIMNQGRVWHTIPQLGAVLDDQWKPADTSMPADMLPTVSAVYDGMKAGTPANSQRRANHNRQLGLTDVVNLLPTPCARDVKGHNRRHNTDCIWGAISLNMPHQLLPTPKCSDGNGPGGKAKDHLNTAIAQLDSRQRLLPTPLWSDATRTSRMDDMKYLPSVAINLNMPHRLLSTPNTMDTLPARTGSALDHALRRGDPNRTPCASTGNLREDVTRMTMDDHGRYGPYTQAIRRWEQTIGRTAPSPDTITRRFLQWTATLPDSMFNPSMFTGIPEASQMDWRFWQQAHANPTQADANIPASVLPPEPVLNQWAVHAATPMPKPRWLNPRFVEWMMGLPDGWVTAPDLWEDPPANPRMLQIRMLGNGVVPRQAAAGIDWCLHIGGRK